MAASPTLESGFDVEAFINEYYHAWSGTDLDRIISYYSESVVLQIPGLIVKGREAVRDPQRGRSPLGGNAVLRRIRRAWLAAYGVASQRPSA
jgi:hypothetical protein